MRFFIYVLLGLSTLIAGFSTKKNAGNIIQLSAEDSGGNEREGSRCYG